MANTNRRSVAADSVKSKRNIDHSCIHTRVDASYDCDNTDSERNDCNRSNGRSLRSLVWQQCDSVRSYWSNQYHLHFDNTWRRISNGNRTSGSRRSRDNRYHKNHNNKLHHYLLIGVLAVTGLPARADNVNNTAAPRSSATGNVTNQAVQVQNNGAPTRQQYGGAIVCNGPTLTITPFVMGNETAPYEDDGYVFSTNVGIQAGVMIPLNGDTVEQCLAMARRQEEKMRLDYELVRALKCAELMQLGFVFRPGAPMAVLCQDVVPISSLIQTGATEIVQ